MLSDQVDEELLEAAGAQLKVIASFSVGTDHVNRDSEMCRNFSLGSLCSRPRTPVMAERN